MQNTRAGSSPADEFGSTDALLGLRFEVPELPHQYVERDRLMRELEDGSGRALTLVSAPAGSGKTTLLAAWVAQRKADEPVGWLTFDAADEGREVFWPLVVEALRRCGLDLMTDIAHASNPLTYDLLTELSLALTRRPSPLTLVLDGLEITDASLAQEIDFLLTHSGRGLRLVMLARADPVLPLHRYRLKEGLTELRMADLAFSPDETAQLMDEFEVVLTGDSLASLIGRARGWAVGLTFAAMLLKRSDDPERTVQQLAGDYGNIAEYLMVESLHTLPPEARDLLLRTSVVEVLQPGLLEELGGHLAGRTLANLARGNVMVEELPGHPGWFRYHPMLRDLLRAELSFASPRRLTRLRRRAARWFATHDQLEAAVELAAASGAWTDAADYVIDGVAVGRLIAPERADPLIGHFRAMPADTAGASACTVRAALALAVGRLDQCESELALARAAADEIGSLERSAVRLTIDVVDAVRARCADDSDAVASTDRAAHRLGLCAPDGSAEHAGVAMLIESNRGLALFRAGRFSSARESLATALQSAEAWGAAPWSISIEAHLALLECVQGRLVSARGQGIHAIGLLETDGPSSDEHIAPEAEIALGWISTEQDDLAAAAEHLRRASIKESTDPVARAVALLVQARLLRADGDAPGALEVIDAARRGLPSRAGWVEDLFGVEAAEALTAQGEPGEALTMVSQLHEPGQGAAELAVAHAQAQQGDWDAVAGSVARLAIDDSASTPLPVVIGGLLLEASLELHRGRPQKARAALYRSLRLAGPEYVRRPFRDAPPAVRKLLKNDPKLLAQNDWLGSDSGAGGTARRHSSPPAAPATVTLADGALIEPLTAKEREVLGRLSELMSTQEIASTMFISVNTVRTHVRSILRKLAVSRRNEAVRRARALGLLGAGDQQLIRSG